MFHMHAMHHNVQSKYRSKYAVCKLNDTFKTKHRDFVINQLPLLYLNLDDALSDIVFIYIITVLTGIYSIHPTWQEIGK